MLLVPGVPQQADMDVMGWSASMAGRYQHVTSEITAAIANKVGGLYCRLEATRGRRRRDEGSGTRVRDN
jgi:hypothetical protein